MNEKGEKGGGGCKSIEEAPEVLCFGSASI